MIVLPDRTHDLGAARRAAVRAVAAADAVGQRFLGHAPVTRELSRRSLWGALRDRAEPRATTGERLLALSFDLDYQRDTDALDRVVDAVDDVGGRMSVVAIGQLVERDPAPYRRAVDHGHELVNHTWSHPDNPVLNPDREWWDLSHDEMVDEVVRAQDSFAELVGVRPAGFRTPHFKDVHRMLPALEAVPELRWLSSALASRTPSGLPYHPALSSVAGDASHLVEPDDARAASRLLMLPLTPCPAHRWSPFCSYHTIRRPPDRATGRGYHGRQDTVRLWRELLERSASAGYAAPYFDPHDVAADDATAAWFTSLLQVAVDAGWRIVALGDVARAHADDASSEP